ncbi:histidine kinase dimerization/phospho-acceptor domain-containing protein [Bacteroides sp.]|uniref:tetratricopeptide repeat-containing sensor histidine kinase n=1 Tax=Bacteroides sp. TaxID=29523 RepID=UPI00260539EC|nr:histidine kinase dimerization/phospho-acceptor domain-containing protein [Bacteroides sp.]
MKQKLFIFTCLILIMVSTIAAQSTTQEKQLRDSVFTVYHSITKASDKINFMRHTFYQNIDKKWVTELLDSILELSITEMDTIAELDIRRDLIVHYKYLSDLPQMENSLKELKAASYKYNLYNYYFQMWNDILQFYNVRGDTEYSRIQALKMEEEAINIKSSSGISFAYLSLGQSLTAAKKEEEAINILKKALESKDLNPLIKAMIHSEIITAYQLTNKIEEAINELNMQKSIFDQIINEDPSLESQYGEKLLEIELTYCACYDKLNDSNNLLKHLNKAKQYYTPNSFFSNYINYHAYWGGYYRLTQQWKDCFREFDKALAHFNHTLPLQEMEIRRMKGKALVEAGHYEDAAILYKDLSIMGDSLNKDVLKYHEEALQANYNIREALFEKYNLEKQYNWIIVIFVLVAIGLLLLMILRAYKGNKALQRAEQETRNALETVDAADKMKDVFLHNIIHQIREPLNVVVGFSSILAIENDLTSELSQEYSAAIKKNAALLFQLIIDVLDLSRLESGMMKFNISECDAVQMCKDAKMGVEMLEHNIVRLSFETKLEEAMVQTDNERFLKMLLSILSAPESNETDIVVVYTLCIEDNQIKIVVENSPLLEQPENIQRIKHDINRLFLETFKGTYQYPRNLDKGDIILTYPLN